MFTIFTSALIRTATNPQQNAYFSNLLFSENRVVPLLSTLLQLWNALLQTSYPSVYQLTRAVDTIESEIVEFLACKNPWAHTYSHCKFYSKLAVVF